MLNLYVKVEGTLGVLRALVLRHLRTDVVKIIRFEQSRFEGELNNKIRDRDAFDMSLLLYKLQ